jgi:hypothetical protein
VKKWRWGSLPQGTTPGNNPREQHDEKSQRHEEEFFGGTQRYSSTQGTMNDFAGYKIL